MSNENSVLLESAADAVDAELWRGVLGAEGIPAVVHERNPLGAAIGLYTGMSNTMYDLFVSENDAEVARALLQAYENGRGEVSEEELAAAAEEMFDERV